MCSMASPLEQEEEHKSMYNTNFAVFLNDLRKEEALCDVTINVSGRAFCAHKVVLAASSRYFRVMFTGGFKESSANELEIDGDPDVFETLLEYLYSGTVDFEAKKYQQVQLLEMALYFQLTDLASLSGIYMKWFSDSQISRMKVEDLCKIGNLSLSHGEELQNITTVVAGHLCSKITDMTASQKCLEVCGESLIEVILKRPELLLTFRTNKIDEAQILEFLVKWLKFDWQNRHPHAARFLGKLHLGLVQEEILQKHLDKEILNDKECKELLQKVQKLQRSGVPRTRLRQMYPDWFGDRTSTAFAVKIFVGDIDRFPPDETFMCYFQTGLKKWQPLPFSSAPHYAGLIMAEGSFYTVGGFDPENGNLTAEEVLAQMKDIFRYDADDDAWEKLPSMLKVHDMESGHLLYHDGAIYVLGGAHYDDNKNDVERFCIDKQTWQKLASLPSPFDFGPAFIYEDKILVYGATEEYSQLGYKHILLVYKPTGDAWETVYAENFKTHYVDNISEWTFVPVVYQHDGDFYRVLYTPSKWSNLLTKPKVNKLNLQSTSSCRGLTVSMGDEIVQDLIPENRLNAFRIKDKVFVNINGFVQKTDVKIGADQTSDVDLSSWKKFRAQKFEDSNYVTCYLDKHHVRL